MALFQVATLTKKLEISNTNQLPYDPPTNQNP
jgi:hypothetical protein